MGVLSEISQSGGPHCGMFALCRCRSSDGTFPVAVAHPGDPRTFWRDVPSCSACFWLSRTPLLILELHHLATWQPNAHRGWLRRQRRISEKTWPVRPVTPSQVLYAGGASPPNTPGNAQEAAMARYRCNLPSAPSRTSISTAFMVPTSKYFSLMPGARGAQCRSRPLSAPADITAPVDASVSPTTIPPAQRVRPCYQQQQQHQQQAPPPSSGADGTPRCSEVEGRDVMRSFYAQHGSIARYGGGWGATRLLRCGASRGSCRRSSRPAPAQTTFRLHLDYMLPALFGARRDHTLAMT